MGETRSRPVVLVVEDDADHLLMLEALLEVSGYDVVCARSCAQACTILSTRTIDALVSDLSLGDGTALDLLRGLSSAERPRVAIVLSGFDSVEDVERTLSAGFDAHLAKPTPPDVLTSTIAAGLRNRQSGVQLVERERAAGDVRVRRIGSSR